MSNSMYKTSLSKAVGEILSPSNKSLSLGEASEKLNSYIITIKELVDSGDISLDELRDEITKHLDGEEKIIPNSLAQLLIGCVGDKDSCLMKQEKAEDIPFIYDSETDTIRALSNVVLPLTNDSTAVLYLTDHPKNIKTGIFKYLESQGFKKLRIEYKDTNSLNYKVIDIDNLKRYIYSQPAEKDIYQSLAILGFILLLVFILYKIQN